MSEYATRCLSLMPMMLSLACKPAVCAGVLFATCSITKGKRSWSKPFSFASNICSPKSSGKVIFVFSSLRSTTIFCLPSITILLMKSFSVSIGSLSMVSMRSPFWKPLFRAVWH